MSSSIILKLYVSMNHFLQFVSLFGDILPFEFLFQMADVSGTILDGAGHAHTNGLHWEGFPRLLWELSSSFATQRCHSTIASHTRQKELPVAP